MTKSGNRHVRWRTTALAWSWRRYQPASARSCWCRARCGGGGKRRRRRGIVAVARKFLMALWRFLETGGVPEGAVRKEGEALWRCGVTSRPWGWWEATRGISGPAKPAVVELVSPPTGLPAVVKRRREHRVTGVRARTESRAIEGNSNGLFHWPRPFPRATGRFPARRRAASSAPYRQQASRRRAAANPSPRAVRQPRD